PVLLDRLGGGRRHCPPRSPWPDPFPPPAGLARTAPRSSGSGSSPASRASSVLRARPTSHGRSSPSRTSRVHGGRPAGAEGRARAGATAWLALRRGYLRLRRMDLSSTAPHRLRPAHPVPFSVLVSIHAPARGATSLSWTLAARTRYEVCTAGEMRGRVEYL